MFSITFPASVVPAGFTVSFDVPKFLHPSSIDGVQGTSVPGTATENGRVYHFWFQRRVDGEVFKLGLSCNGQPIKPHHKLALRAVILAAYAYATRGRDMGVQADMHVERMLNARTAATCDLSGLCNVERSACEDGPLRATIASRLFYLDECPAEPAFPHLPAEVVAVMMGGRNVQTISDCSDPLRVQEHRMRES